MASHARVLAEKGWNSKNLRVHRFWQLQVETSWVLKVSPKQFKIQMKRFCVEHVRVEGAGMMAVGF